MTCYYSYGTCCWVNWVYSVALVVGVETAGRGSVVSSSVGGSAAAVWGIPVEHSSYGKETQAALSNCINPHTTINNQESGTPLHL